MVRGQAPRAALLVHLDEKRTYPFHSQMAKVEAERNCLINRNSSILGSRERVERSLEVLFGPLVTHKSPPTTPSAIYQAVSLGKLVNKERVVGKGFSEAYIPANPHSNHLHRWYSINAPKPISTAPASHMLKSTIGTGSSRKCSYKLGSRTVGRIVSVAVSTCTRV